MKAWHFTTDKLRDGRRVPAVGKKLVHKGPLMLCKSGLHASRRLIDALRYAPGCILHRVELSGEIIKDEDKVVATERTILWRMDVEDLLRDFARRCALDVIDAWDAPDVVVQYLKTGDEELRSAAYSAAYWAAHSAADSAAHSAAYWAAHSAAKSAAYSTVNSAAYSIVNSAAYYYLAAGSAADSAAYSTVNSAAYYYLAAGSAVRTSQNQRLTSMVMAAR